MSDVGMPKPEAAELTDGSDVLPTQLAAMSSVACTVGGAELWRSGGSGCRRLGF